MCVKNNVWQSVDHNFLEVIECSKIKYFRARQARDMISMNIFVWVAVKLIKISVPSSHQSQSRILNEAPFQFPPLPVLPLKSNILQIDAFTLCYHTSPNHHHLSLGDTGFCKRLCMISMFPLFLSSNLKKIHF